MSDVVSNIPNVQDPDELLTVLRELMKQAFSREVLEAVKKTDEKSIAIFVVERTRLGEVILGLETTQAVDIRRWLEEQSEVLTEAIVELIRSLKELDQAAQWGQRLGQVLVLVRRALRSSERSGSRSHRAR